MHVSFAPKKNPKKKYLLGLVHVSVAQRVRQQLALATTPTVQQKGVFQRERKKKRHVSVAQRVRQHLLSLPREILKSTL